MIDKEKLKALAEAAQNDSGDYAALNDYGMAVPPAVALALLAEIEALRESANFRAVQSLRADCEALRKDAERYRWLRSRSLEGEDAFWIAAAHGHPTRWAMGGDDPEGCDAAIDAAMTEEVQP